MADGSEVEVLKSEGLKTDVLLREISVTGSQIYKAYNIVDFNPDELVGKKGLPIYRSMMNDDQLKAVVTMKKFARLMTPWGIQPASQDARDLEIAQFVEDQIEGLAGTFEDNLLNIFTALEYGFSVTELLFNRIDRGRWHGKIGLSGLKTREPFFYGFDSDQYGNLKPDGIVYQGAIMANQESFGLDPKTGLWGLSMSYGIPVQRLPVSKFVIFSYNKTFSNWYGQSDLRAAYRSWWSKEVLIRFMNIYMERFGMPTHVGKYPKGTRKEDREELKDILDRVQSKYSIVIPDDVEVALLQAVQGGESGYRSAIEMHNKFMARSVLVPDLVGYTEVSGGGSYALGRKHFDVFLWILKQLGRQTEEGIVGEQIIHRLVDINFGKVDRYPKFRFESITEEGTQAKAQIVAMGVANGFINPEEDWIREYLSLPKAAPGTALGVPVIRMPGVDGGGTKEGPEVAGVDEGVGGQELPEQALGVDGLEKLSRIGVYTKLLRQKYRFRGPEASSSKVSMSLGSRVVEPTVFDRKLDPTKAGKKLSAYREESVRALAEIIRRQKLALLNDIQRRDLLKAGSGRVSDIDKVSLKYVGDFKRELEKRLVKLYLDSKLKSVFELVRGGVPIEVSTRFDEVMVQMWEPLPPLEALDFFNRKVLAKITRRDGKKVLLDLATNAELPYYSSKAFAVSGIERDYILSQVKQILLEGLRSGDSRQTMFNLETLFDEYLQTGEIEDGELVRPARLEAIVRTNESEALTAGRKALFQDPDVVDFVPFWQYTAVLDDRVRQPHERMHGRIYRSTDPIWERITPPNGFNCRCSITAVTTFEVDKVGGVVVSREPIPVDFPDRGFMKFSDTIKVRMAQIETEEFLSGEKTVSVKVETPKKEAPLTKEDVLGILNSRDWISGPDGRMVRTARVEKVVVAVETPKLEEFKRQIEEQQKQIVSLQGILKESTKLSSKEVELLKEELEQFQDKIKELQTARELEKLRVSEGHLLGYDWVTRCAYRGCASSVVVPVRELPGAFVYRCDSCKHIFKVLQEGDVYFYDVGKEEWVSGEFSLRPSYFSVEIDGKVYCFETELERDRKQEMWRRVVDG